MHSKSRQTVFLPPLEDKLGILENDWCMPVGVNVTLVDFGRVPFLTSVSDKMILLQSPASRVYVGRQTAILTFFDESDRTIGQ